MSKLNKAVYRCSNCGVEYIGGEGGTTDAHFCGQFEGKHERLNVGIRIYHQGHGFRLYNGQTDRDLCHACLKSAVTAAIFGAREVDS